MQRHTGPGAPAPVVAAEATAMNRRASAPQRYPPRRHKSSSSRPSRTTARAGWPRPSGSRDHCGRLRSRRRTTISAFCCTSAANVRGAGRIPQGDRDQSRRPGSQYRARGCASSTTPRRHRRAIAARCRSPDHLRPTTISACCCPTGRHAEALECYRRALAVNRATPMRSTIRRSRSGDRAIPRRPSRCGRSWSRAIPTTPGPGLPGRQMG